MALRKQKIWHGIAVEYWCITERKWNKSSNATSFTISAYKDDATRIASVYNIIPDLTYKNTFVGELTSADIYTKMKESNIQQVEIGTDENDNPIYELKELNFFVDAEDC